MFFSNFSLLVFSLQVAVAPPVQLEVPLPSWRPRDLPKEPSFKGGA